MTNIPAPVNVNLPSPAASSFKGAEILRVFLPVIIIVIIIVAYKKFLSGTFDALKSPFVAAGIADSEEEKKDKEKAKEKVKKIEKSADNPFNQLYYKNQQKKGGIKLVTAAATKKICKQIYDGIGLITDSPDQIFGAIKQLSAKTQVSFIAENFNAIYKKDLLEFLNDKLDTTEQKIVLGKIIDYVNSLPIGKQ